MSMEFFAHRTFWNIPFVSMLLLLLIGMLAGCGSGNGKPPAHTPTFEGKLSLLQVPSPYTLPGRIVLGPDRNLWFPAIAYTDFGTNSPSGAIGRLMPDGTFHMFPMPTLNSYPTQVAIGWDGSLWFTMVQGNGQVAHGLDTPPYFRDAYGEIGKMTLDGKFSMFALPSSHASLSGIAAGPDGNLWFTEAVRVSDTTSIHKIGRLTSSGSFSEFALTPLNGNDITGPMIAGPDGNLWFAIESTGPNYDALGKIGRITPRGALTVFTLGLFTVPQDLIVGPDHNLWFTSGSSIGRMTTDGQVRTFTPSGNLNNRIYTGGLTLGTDGAIWFATANVAVGRISTDGTFKFYPFPANTYFDNGSSSLTIGELKGITSGADGTLWLTDSGQIGHFV